MKPLVFFSTAFAGAFFLIAAKLVTVQTHFAIHDVFLHIDADTSRVTTHFCSVMLETALEAILLLSAVMAFDIVNRFRKLPPVLLTIILAAPLLYLFSTILWDDSCLKIWRSGIRLAWYVGLKLPLYFFGVWMYLRRVANLTRRDYLVVLLAFAGYMAAKMGSVYIF